MNNLLKKVLLPFFSFLLALISCSDNGVAGGGGIDVGNPAKVCVIDTLNKPIAGASVKILPSERWLKNIFKTGTFVADSSYTGEDGFAIFDSLPKGNYTIQVDHVSGGAFVAESAVTDSQLNITVILKKSGKISGVIHADTDVPAQIRLAHTTYSAKINSNKTFTISNIPQGVFVPFIMTTDSQWTPGLSIKVGSSLAVEREMALAFKKLLVDDFEDESTSNKLALFVKNGHIFTAAQAGSDASAEYEITSDGFTGNALKGLLIRKSMWALLGFTLGIKAEDDSLWNFSSAKSLSFQAKGEGTLNVSLESDSLDKKGFVKHYSSSVMLQPQWQNFTIKFDSLTFFNDLNPNPDIPWSEASRSIKRIEFNALQGDTVQFWLDNLTIDGVNLSNIY